MGPKELNGLGLSRVEKVEEYEEVAAGAKVGYSIQKNLVKPRQNSVLEHLPRSYELSR